MPTTERARPVRNVIGRLRRAARDVLVIEVVTKDGVHLRRSYRVSATLSDPRASALQRRATAQMLSSVSLSVHHIPTADAATQLARQLVQPLPGARLLTQLINDLLDAHRARVAAAELRLLARRASNARRKGDAGP